MHGGYQRSEYGPGTNRPCDRLRPGQETERGLRPRTYEPEQAVQGAAAPREGMSQGVGAAIWSPGCRCPAGLSGGTLANAAWFHAHRSGGLRAVLRAVSTRLSLRDHRAVVGPQAFRSLGQDDRRGCLSSVESSRAGMPEAIWVCVPRTHADEKPPRIEEGQAPLRAACSPFEVARQTERKSKNCHLIRRFRPSKALATAC